MVPGRLSADDNAVIHHNNDFTTEDMEVGEISYSSEEDTNPANSGAEGQDFQPVLNKSQKKNKNVSRAVNTTPLVIPTHHKLKH